MSTRYRAKLIVFLDIAYTLGRQRMTDIYVTTSILYTYENLLKCFFIRTAYQQNMRIRQSDRL